VTRLFAPAGLPEFGCQFEELRVSGVHATRYGPELWVLWAAGFAGSLGKRLAPGYDPYWIQNPIS